MPTAIVRIATSENPGLLRSARTAFLRSVMVDALTRPRLAMRLQRFAEPLPSPRPPTKPRKHEGPEEGACDRLEASRRSHTRSLRAPRAPRFPPASPPSRRLPAPPP